MREHCLRWTTAGLLLIAAVASGCEVVERGTPGADSAAAGSDPGASGMSPVPEATSLLGEPLYAMPLAPEREAAMRAQLDSAESALEMRPGDADAIIWVGRRLAYLGHYRDAIEVFTEGVEAHPDDPRMYRHRGHRYITVRELDRAVDDLAHAARLTSGQEDVVEPDGQPNEAGVPRSTLQTNIWYHLGLARYLQGDWAGAVQAYRRGLELSENDDMRVAMADWLWLALRRMGREEEAARALAFVDPEMDILENDAYHRRLLMYKGLLSPDSLAPALSGGPGAGTEPAAGSVPGDSAPAIADDRTLQLATYGYGLGTWHLVRGDTARARDIYRQVLDTGYWPAFGYIASEAELARLPGGR